MFIINGGTISNSKQFNIINDNTPTFAFDFQGGTFNETDTFTLTAGTISNTDYGFRKDGIIKFQNVDLGELTSGANTVNISIARNGDSILTDTITVNNPQGGGGGTPQQPYELPKTTAKKQFYIVKENGTYKFSTTASYFADKLTVQPSATNSTEITCSLTQNYEISPFDTILLAVNLDNSTSLSNRDYLDLEAQLYIDNVLIRKGGIKRLYSYRLEVPNIIINLNENYSNELITDNIGKVLKVVVKAYNRGTSSINYYINGTTPSSVYKDIQPIGTNKQQTAGWKLLKNYELTDFNSIYGMPNFANQLPNIITKKFNSLIGDYSKKATVVKYDDDIVGGEYQVVIDNTATTDFIYIPKTYKHDEVTPPTVISLLDVTMNLQFANDYLDKYTLIIFRTDDTFTFSFNLITQQNWTWDEDQGDYIQQESISVYDKKDVLINKPFAFQPNKKYMIYIYRNYIMWTELEDYFSDSSSSSSSL